MELKRGWWKLKNGAGYAYLAGEFKGDWYGSHKGHGLKWEHEGSSISLDCQIRDLGNIYCGDGPEPVEPEKQPDPRDAEIERLKAENEKLLNAINSQSSEINRLLTKCQRLDVKLATIKTEYNNLARIIGDH